MTNIYVANYHFSLVSLVLWYSVLKSQEQSNFFLGTFDDSLMRYKHLKISNKF